MDHNPFLVDYYAKITDNTATETRPLSHILQAIKGDTYQKRVEAVRAIQPGDASSKAHSARSQAKQALAYFTPCCMCHPTRSNANLRQHNGLIHGDLDHVANLAAARKALEADPLTVFCFLSPSGHGLKVALRGPSVTDKDAYKDWWVTAATYHKARYGLTWDAQSSDICRACYVSWDPALYVNLDALELPEAEALRRLTPLLKALDTAPPGTYNGTRNKQAWTFGGLVATTVMPEQPGLTLLQEAAAHNTTTPDKARHEIQHSCTEGMQKPFAANGRRKSTQPDVRMPQDTNGAYAEPDDTTTDPALAPYIPLPEKLQPDTERAATACQWLDDYIAYSQKWSPRGAPLLHETVGIWLLSVIAGGRIHCDLGPSHITTLMLAVCAPSSVYAKSTTVNLSIRLLGQAGLGGLLHADESTPQALLKSMAKPPIPDEFFLLPDTERATITTRAAFAGQRSWFYEEWGQQLKQMQRSDGPMALLHGLLRRLDDGRLSHASDTIARGREEVTDPYLSLIANCTPADLAPYCGLGHAYWHDGLWARFAFIGAGEATPSRARLPRRHRFQIPTGLVKDARGWHTYLGIPDVTILHEDDDEQRSPTRKRSDKKKRRALRAVVRRHPPHHPAIPDVLYDAYDAYDDAMAAIGQQLPDDWHSCYARYHTRAARIAALLSSMDYYTRVGDLKDAKIERPIELKHWHRAVAIVERWRESHHLLMAHIHTLDYTPPTAQAKLEQHIISLTQQEPQTMRNLRRRTKKSYEDIGRAITTLERADVIQKDEQGKTFVYRLRI